MGFARATAEKDKRVARRLGSGVDKQWYQPPPDLPDMSQTLVTAIIRLQKRREPWRLRPQPHQIVIVVFKNNAPAGTHGARHGLYDRQWLPQVFEQEPRMRKIEGTPFLISQRKPQRIASSKFHKAGFSGLRGLPFGFGDLFGAAFDADHARARRARHRPRQLPQPAAHIEDAFSAL